MAPSYSVSAKNVATAPAEINNPAAPVTTKAVGNEILGKSTEGMGAANAATQPMEKPTAEPVEKVTAAGGAMRHEGDRPSSGEIISGVQHYIGVLSD